MQAASRNIAHVVVMVVVNLDNMVVTVVVATVEVIVLLARQQAEPEVKNHGAVVNAAMIVAAANLQVEVTKRDINLK